MKQNAEQRAEKKFPMDHYTHQVQREAYARAIREEVEPLEAWKESAVKVMGEWYKVWEALNNPGKLGESTAASSLAEVERLRALVQAGEELAGRIGCGCGGDLSECGECNAAIQQWFSAKRDKKQADFVPTNTAE